MTQVLILNGPNLNMLGQRQPEIYGKHSLKDIEDLCQETAKKLGFTLDFRQSNYEGELVTWLQKTMGKVDGILINAAAYTHTSVAILDALLLHDCPVVEVHLSDPKTREAFRHNSFIAERADHICAGDGADSYVNALEWLSAKLSK